MEKAVPAPSLVAYRAEPWGLDMQITPAPVRRAWMDQAESRHPYHCLPLMVANQSGWFVRSSNTFEVVWNGDNAKSGLTIRHLDGEPPFSAASHFGGGIVSFHLAYLFKTSPGYNLLARGPANLPKDGACALEAVIETDWSAVTFVMNWQITRPNHRIVFERDEPICMLVPQRAGELERFSPEIRDLDSDGDVRAAYRAFRSSRDAFINDVLTSRAGRPTNCVQGDYMRGELPGGAVASRLQTKMRLRAFNDRSSRRRNGDE
jgi:hypothetical protein